MYGKLEVGVVASNWMTVADVEDVRHAVQLNRGNDRIARALAFKTNVTLPALMEYGCLRWTHPDLPFLPMALQNSVVGRELCRVSSPFGLHNFGIGSTESFEINVRPCEFMTFTTTTDLVGDAPSFFISRFGKSAVSVGFGKMVANYLEAGLMQMIENAIQHARTSVPMLAGYAVGEGTAQFTVVDVGQGVLEALRQSDKYKHIHLHGEAIRLALRPGVTSHSSGTGGNGFLDIFHALANEWGLMRFRSGEACVIADGTGLTYRSGGSVPVADFPGFQVSVTCCATAAALEHPTM